MENNINDDKGTTIRGRKKNGFNLVEKGDDFFLTNRESMLEFYDQSNKGIVIGAYYHPKVVKETSLERIERKIDNLRIEVATKDDVIAQTKQLLSHQEEMNKSLEEKITVLRSMQESNVPHKRLAKYSIVLLVFFIVSFISRIFFDVIIVTQLWNNLGLLLSFGFFIMALAMGIDWKKQIKK